MHMDIITTSEMRATRKIICKSCDQLSKLNTCNACGCFVPAKVFLAASDCKLGKWPKIVDSSVDQPTKE